jgi:hypothetical protein
MSEVSFNVLYSTRLTQRKKQWTDGVAVFSRPPSAKRIKLRIVDEDGRDVLNTWYADSIPSENDEIIASGLLIQISSKLSDSNPDPPIHPQPPKAWVRKPLAPIRVNSIPPKVAAISPPPEIPAPAIRESQLKPTRTFDKILSFFLCDDIRPEDLVPEPPLPIHEPLAASIPDPLNATIPDPPDVLDTVVPTEPPAPEISLYWEERALGPVPTVPVSFLSAEEYKTRLMRALEYEINYKIHETFLLYLAAVFSSSVTPPKCQHHGPTLFCINKRGGYFYRCSHCNFRQTVPPDKVGARSPKNIGQVASFLQRKGVAFHSCNFLNRSGNYAIHFLNDKCLE